MKEGIETEKMTDFIPVTDIKIMCLVTKRIRTAKFMFLKYREPFMQIPIYSFGSLTVLTRAKICSLFPTNTT